MYRARYRRIVFFFARVLLSHVYWDLLLPRLGLGNYSRRSRSQRFRRSAVAFRKLAVQMGGVLIKVGQFLSSRVDVLPPEITDELKGLQDEVPPVPFSAIRNVIEAEFQAPIGTVFQAIEEQPLAAASLGQVHRARLNGLAVKQAESAPGEAQNSTVPAATPAPAWQNNVVIKILRPNIEQIIAVDLEALQTVGSWLNRYPPIRKRADVPSLLVEFTRILYEEIDYLAEGRNAETFAANFQADPGVRVPRVVWSHTTRRVLTLENVWAIKITDYDAITAAGIARAEVASRLLDTYLKQIFEDGFFHADPHPGNLFVQPLPSPRSASGVTTQRWRLTFVDFGMVGHVPENLRAGLREMLIGVGTQDSARVVKSYQMMDLLLPDADLNLLERAGSLMFERFWGKNMSELTSLTYTEMREFTEEFRELIYDLPFQVPQNLIFLGRCVGILSGMCTGLDPQFNVWDHLAPYAQKMIADEARTGYDFWLGEAAKWGRSLLSLPQRMDLMLLRLEAGEVSVRTPEINQQATRLENALRQVTLGLVFMALTLGGVQLYLGEKAWFSGIFFLGAFFVLGWIWQVGKSRKR
jgi:predicted unusual protein kinase regulating ubiquinone biosynthesis (AarF/ABC1/UbiB family)